MNLLRSLKDSSQLVAHLRVESIGKRGQARRGGLGDEATNVAPQFVSATRLRKRGVLDGVCPAPSGVRVGRWATEDLSHAWVSGRVATKNTNPPRVQSPRGLSWLCARPS